MRYVIIAVAWVAVGATVGVIEARRGHWHRGWVLSAVFGPFAVPLAWERSKMAPPPPVVLERSRAHRGPVDVLIGLDGSASSMSAATKALELLGPRARRTTLATVLDLDTAEPHAASLLNPEPWPEETSARRQLEAATATLEARSGTTPGSVILAGEPADALSRYAREEGYELIVVGCRGRGLTQRLLGSCAAKLAGGTAVPVLLVPSEADDAPQEVGSGATAAPR